MGRDPLEGGSLQNKLPLMLGLVLGVRNILEKQLEPSISLEMDGN